jgi:hypothetical protein
MKRIYTLVELENGWTITETQKNNEVGVEHVDVKRKFIAETLAGAILKVAELGEVGGLEHVGAIANQG